MKRFLFVVFLAFVGVMTSAQNMGSVPGIVITDEGTGGGRATKLDCAGAGVTCTTSGTTVTMTIPGGGGGGTGGPAVDAGYIVVTGQSSGSTNERALTNGTNTTIDTGTAGVIKVNLSGTIAGSLGGLGAAQPTCSAGDVITCNGTTCSCTTPTGSGMTSDQALSRAALLP